MTPAKRFVTLMGSASTSRSPSASLSASHRLSTISRHLATSSNMSSSAQKVPPSAPYVEYTKEGTMRIYKLNKPAQLNALNLEMILSLKEKMKTWRESELCQVILGRGDQRAFCAGGDVKQLILDLKEGKNTALAFFKDEFELNWAMARLGKPYIALMDGIVMGGGCGIALPAPIRIATSRSHFAMPETKIGYAPDVGVSYYLAQLDGAIGAWLAVTGQDVFGRAVFELGLATHYIPVDSIDAALHDIQQLENPALEKISACLANFTPGHPPSSAPFSSKQDRDGPSPIRGEILEFLNHTFGQKSLQEIHAALDRAAADEMLSEEVKVWAKEQQAQMALRSPTGMAVALENYRRAKKNRRLDMTLDNDMSMATGFSGPNRVTDDFITGVTAVLVSRTKGRPDWSPSEISDPAVSDSVIAEQFFDTSSPNLKSDRPRLVFDPPSTSKRSEKQDSTWGQFRKYGLPSEMEVEAAVTGAAPGSGAFKVTETELVEKLLDARGNTGGPRAEEMDAKAREIVRRLCDITEGGYLDWKRS